MSLADWLDSEGGIRHVEQALGAGYTRYAIRTAVAQGAVRRLRRTWIATPAAPALLRTAASLGGRVACITAARLHGLWAIDDDRPHFAVAHGASRFDAGGARVHWNAGPIGPTRFELVESVVDALVHIAGCRPLDHALATWESALRSGRVDTEYLARLPLRHTAAHRVRDGASQLSDSGLESIAFARLRRIGLAIRQQVRLAGHSVDGLVGSRLVIQIDGYEFHRDAASRRRDIAHDRRLALMGFTVLRFDYEQVLFGWPAVEHEVRAAVAVGLHEIRDIRSSGERTPFRPAPRETA
ncbi:type IV toxin-antitoxin system AbiEi family antitoxin domain-containing protein [Agromyces salentinus]|uniref:Type IV toxin-antitoxin system AbiEi family antitoxin domain-containing protein n=2 Tax=Agromyces salentinus TaxID=269421 RepID=A0ABP4Z2D4_9MICO